MAIEQNQTTKNPTPQSAVQSFTDSARHIMEPVQKRLAEIPMPSQRTQMIIASGIALGAVGVVAYFVARRKPRLGLFASLTGPAMVAWSAYQKAMKQAQQEIRSQLH